MNNRIAIRKKVKEILENANLKIKHISIMRPNPVFLQELPHCCVFYKTENVELSRGSTNTVKEYKRTLKLSIDLITSGSPDAEDFLDIEAFKIEANLLKDPRLGGLSIGIMQEDTTPYVLEGDSEVVLWGVSLKFDIPYTTDTYLDEKFQTFESYYLEINKEHYTDDTVDKILISADNKF